MLGSRASLYRMLFMYTPRLETEDRIEGDVSTKAGCLAIAEALTKEGVTKVRCTPSVPPMFTNESIQRRKTDCEDRYSCELRRGGQAMEKSYYGT